MDKILSQFNTKKWLAVGLAIFVVALVSSAVLIRKTYLDNLSPVGGDKNGIVYTVQPGSTTSEVADGLEAKGLIRSDWAFEWYVRNHELRDQIKAGTYLLNKSQGVEEIVDSL
jgi:UPF0755 protein